MPGEIMRSEIAEIPAVFRRLLDDVGIFNQARELLTTSTISSVLVLARGTSDNAAHFLKYLIETKLGIPVGLTSPSSVTIYDTTLHFQNVLVVAVSQSGQSPDLITYAKAAQRGGAKLISLTNDLRSPLALAADLHIDLSAGPELAVAATKSYAAELLASYLLVCAWTGVEHGADSLPKIAQSLISLDISTAVRECDIREEIVILGRGFSYPNAREAALKIQETNKVSVQGLSTADYLHGPISALTEKTQVFFIAPNYLPLHSIEDEVRRIRLNSPKIFWFGRGGAPIAGEWVVGGASASNEILASIADAVIIQRFVLELCLLNGLDPDSPTGLSKVTLTY
jgi:glucosamine--fructose-6-phosphate aminotransferase (isomerizing)